MKDYLLNSGWIYGLIAVCWFIFLFYFILLVEIEKVLEKILIYKIGCIKELFTLKTIYVIYKFNIYSSYNRFLGVNRLERGFSVTDIENVFPLEFKIPYYFYLFLIKSYYEKGTFDLYDFLIEIYKNDHADEYKLIKHIERNFCEQFREQFDMAAVITGHIYYRGEKNEF